MKIWKYVLAAFLPLLALSCSKGIEQSHRGAGISAETKDSGASDWGRVNEDKDNENTPPRRLESVTWDSVKHKLKWEISTGKNIGDGYRPHSSNRYEINMDRATMTFNGASRRFSRDEALRVRALMDFVSKYAVESTVWWELGEGEPIDDKDTPTKPDSRPKPDNGPGEGGKVKAIGIVAMQLAAE